MAVLAEYAAVRDAVKRRKGGKVNRLASPISRAYMIDLKLRQDILEDAQLNAIADEREDGPFVQVSLDDL